MLNTPGRLGNPSQPRQPAGNANSSLLPTLAGGHWASQLSGGDIPCHSPFLQVQTLRPKETEALESNVTTVDSIKGYFVQASGYSG
jgi:hypothetical protein